MSEENKKPTATLCWNCANATGGCRWSRRLRPVEGWKIIKTKKTSYDGRDYASCIVIECPEFKRDAVSNGLKRYKDGVVYVPVSKDT